MLGSIISAGASLLGGLAQKGSADDANAVSAGQLALSREQFEWMRDLQERIIASQLAPVTTARGDVTSYDEEEGWKTVLSAISQAIMEAGDAETLARLTGDMAIRREGLQDAATRRREEGLVADSLLAGMGRGKYDVDDIQGKLDLATRRGVNEAYETAETNVMRDALRTGESGGKALAALMKQKSRDLTAGLQDAAIRAPQEFETLETQRLNRTLSPYLNLAARATNFENLPMENPGTESMLLNAMLGQRGSLPGAGAAAGASTTSALNSANAAGGLNMRGILGAGQAEANMYNSVGNIFGSLSDIWGARGGSGGGSSLYGASAGWH